MANPQNIAAGLMGMAVLLLLAVRAWGWSLLIMAITFVAFGFVGPWLPGLLERYYREAGWDIPEPVSFQPDS